MNLINDARTFARKAGVPPALRDHANSGPREGATPVAPSRRLTGLLPLVACALLTLCGLRANAQDGTSAPRVEQPAPNTVLGVAEVSVSGAYEGDLVSVSCNDREGVVFGSKFVVEHVPLSGGQNHLLVRRTAALLGVHPLAAEALRSGLRRGSFGESLRRTRGLPPGSIS